jgi:hypothetical protein
MFEIHHHLRAIEPAQNVRDYLYRREEDSDHERLATSGIVVVAREGERYLVSSGNLVERTDAPPLVAWLEQLRGLDKAGLKALHKKRMRQPPTPRGSAGLGLIEMARKATMPLEYVLSTVDERYAFFSPRVRI